LVGAVLADPDGDRRFSRTVKTEPVGVVTYQRAPVRVAESAARAGIARRFDLVRHRHLVVLAAQDAGAQWHRVFTRIEDWVGRIDRLDGVKQAVINHPRRQPVL
jgi:hypothetical protein